MPQSQPSTGASTPIPAASGPRRFTRASLLASSGSSPAPSVTSLSTGKSALRASSPARVPCSETVSSTATPMELISDEASDFTSATSMIQTPVSQQVDNWPADKTSSLVIELPTIQAEAAKEHTLSTNHLSPTAKGKLPAAVVADSEGEDAGFSDESPDAKFARRLQREEFERDIPATQSAKPQKRQHARIASVVSGPHPNKKRRFIPDSDDGLQSDMDMDSHVAAGTHFVDDNLEAGNSHYHSAEISDPHIPSDFTSLSSTHDLDERRFFESEEKSKAVFDEKSLSKSGEKQKVVRDHSSEDEPLSKGKGKAIATQVPRRTKDFVSKRTHVELEDSDGDDSDDIDNSDISDISDNADSDTADSMDDSDSDDANEDTIPSIHHHANNGNDSVDPPSPNRDIRQIAASRKAYRHGNKKRQQTERERLEDHHPELLTMWDDLRLAPAISATRAEQPSTISRQLKPFQLDGLAWMKEMEKQEWRGGLLGDEMGLGKTIQAVSLIMSDYPAKRPSLVLVPPVALMQWQSEIQSYTDGTLKTFVFHGTNAKTKGITVKELKKYDVIMMSYNSLQSMYSKQEQGSKRKDGIHKEKSLIHAIRFHRIILDEAHCIKTRTTMTAKACFALKTRYRWCLTGTPLQNRIGELFSLIRFLNIKPFSSYLCKQCSCSRLEWVMNDDHRCTGCGHGGLQHVSVFNQELLNPIQKFGNYGPGREAFRKLRLMTERIMLRRLKKDHTNAMELPVKEIYVDRQFFGEEENDFASSIMTNGQRKFDTYVHQGVLLNNYANIFGLIMQMRQVADHPDLILKKNADGGQNVLICCICDESAEDTVRSRCKHEFCRACVASYVHSTEEPDCPRCHIPLSIDLEQPEIEQDQYMVKKSSIVNRIKMDNWTSSSKIELLVHELHKLRSNNASHKSIIFSQFTTMLQLVEWRLRRAGITTVMLDGSMTPAQRQASIDHFMNNVHVECFLVSLKAGGVALNLTEASRVFIVDPWWNPAAEWQSADRCHRIGQTRPCTITRLCIEDSVESRMVLIQEKKTSMIHSTVNGDVKAMETLSPEDLQFLFRGT